MVHMFLTRSEAEAAAARQARKASAARSVPQVCSSQGRQAILLASHLSHEQKELVEAAAVPLRYSVSTLPIWVPPPSPVVSPSFATCSRPGLFGARNGGLSLHSLAVRDAELCRTAPEALPPGLGSSPRAAACGRGGLYLLNIKATAVDFHKRSPEGEWSVLESFGDVPLERTGGLVTIDSDRGELWLVGSCGAEEAGQAGSSPSLYCYSLASKRWRAVEAAGDGPVGAQLLKVSAAAGGGKLLALSILRNAAGNIPGDRLQAHSLDVGALTWTALGTIAVPAQGKASTAFEPMVSEFQVGAGQARASVAFAPPPPLRPTARGPRRRLQGGKSWMVALEDGYDRTLYRQVYEFSNSESNLESTSRWRAVDLTPMRPDVVQGRVQLPFVPEEPSLLGANFVRACDAAATASSASPRPPWRAYIRRKVREEARAPEPAAPAGVGAAMMPCAADFAHFISPQSGMFTRTQSLYLVEGNHKYSALLPLPLLQGCTGSSGPSGRWRAPAEQTPLPPRA